MPSPLTIGLNQSGFVEVTVAQTGNRSGGRRDHSGLLVPVDAVSGLPNDERDRSAHARSSPRCGRHQPNSGAVLPLMPAERAVRRTRATIANEYRRRDARGASAAGARRVKRGRQLRRPMERKVMNWFSRTTSIAGMQVSNWILVIMAVVVLWIIYSAFIGH